MRFATKSTEDLSDCCLYIPPVPTSPLMVFRNVDTQSVFKWVLKGRGRLTWYAMHCKKRKLTYREFVAELEALRRDVLRTPDGILMNPECNETLDMVAINEGWKALDIKTMDRLHLSKP